MIMVAAVAGRLADSPSDGRRIEWVALDFDAMAKGHQRVTTDAGTAVAISLVRGGRLADGDILYVDAERVIAVKAAADDTLVISPVEPMQWGLVGFQLGNRHCVAFFQPAEVLVPYDHTLEALLRDLGVPVRRERRPLVGVRASAHAH
jgi:urease accessory protein